MKRRNKAETGGREDINPNTPSQDDETDILREVGAESDENGETVADEESVVALGAVDATTVRENRRLNEVVKKKRANAKNISFNTGDLLTLYETLIKIWPANTLDINVRRLTGSPVTRVIISRPRSQRELYEALTRDVHGIHVEAEYEVKFFDVNSKQYRATGRITLPDTTHERAPQGQHPMNYPQPPYGYPPQGAGYGAPAPGPAPQHAPAIGGLDVAGLEQVFNLLRQVQSSAAPPVAYAPPAAPTASIEQVLELMRAVLTGAPVPAPAPAPVPAPQPVVPPAPPPMGMIHVPGFGYVSVQKLMTAISGEPAARPVRPPPPGSGYRYEGQEEQPPRYGQQYAPQNGYRPRVQEVAPPATPAAQFKDAMATIRSTMEGLQQLREIPGFEGFEGGGGNHQSQEGGGRGDSQNGAEDEGDASVSIIDTGVAKLVIDKKDGRMRPMETAWANSDKLMKWVGEQVDQFQRGRPARGSQVEVQQVRPPPRRQLPNGFVEVTPDFQPPPGYRAVIVNQDEVPYEQPAQQQEPQYASPLPPPPASVPPPLGASSPEGPRAWQMPNLE